MFKLKQLLLFFFIVLCLPITGITEEHMNNKDKSFQINWFNYDEDGNVEIPLYFFWSEKCPHCTEARPVIEQMGKDISWLHLHSYSTSNKENFELYKKMAASLEQEALSVPAFFICGLMLTGFDEKISPAQLENIIHDCYKQVQNQVTSPSIELENTVNIPFIGEIDTSTLSLPILTLVIAGLDSFNPCAFYVLLFLLSMLIHAQSRLRMIIISGLFITISAAVYFMFMAAWLNLFILIGDSQWIILTAGLIAILMGSINIKDFFWFKQGISLSISEPRKKGLIQKVRGLINTDNMSTMVIGTIILAFVANSYELLCTAGFPMIYTRALTLNELPESTYYLYLLFYNLVYIIPLLIIASIIIITFGSRKLQEHEGRSLKLLSGVMMLCLGFILSFFPILLNNIFTAIGIMLISILITVLFNRILRKSFF